jgi:RimJ/RimL family protein N-acetyltransferase
MRYAIEWGELRAVEPTHAELEQHAAALSAAYNEPRNADLMGHTAEISPAEVVEMYTEGIAAGMRAFLLFQNGELAGDADLRGLRDGSAEFAFMIAMPTQQGRGLGTRFALMVHAFGFRELGLERIYASVAPHNAASLRAFEKLGYVIDRSDAARAYADEPEDVTLAIERERFEHVHAHALASIRIGVR